MSDKKIVYTTTASREEADSIARGLVGARLAACVNILGPMQSIYRWKGQVESSPEWLLIIKTTAAAFERVRDKVRLLHSYELPECIQLPIEAGYAPYLNWIEDSVD